MTSHHVNYYRQYYGADQLIQRASFHFVHCELYFSTTPELLLNLGLMPDYINLLRFN